MKYESALYLGHVVTKCDECKKQKVFDALAGQPAEMIFGYCS